MANLSTLKALTSDQLGQIHDATLQLLEEEGFYFGSDEALEYLRKAGAKIDGKMARLPRAMVEDAIKLTPAEFKFRSYNDKDSIIVGRDSLFGTTMSGTQIHEEKTGRRSSTLEDQIKALKINQAADVIDFISMHIVESCDISPINKHLILPYETYKNCSKPAIPYSMMFKQWELDEFFELLEISHGKLSQDNIVTVGSIAAASPLTYEAPNLTGLINYVKRGQAVGLVMAAQLGVNAPMTFLGNAISQNMEALAGITLVQSINPGTAVVCQISNHISNMKSITSAWGSPESQLCCIANIQLMSDLYKIPTRNIVGVTATEVNYQAAVETMQSVLVSTLSGSHMNFITCGNLENIMAYSFEKQILDEEICSRAKRIRQGISFDTDDFCMDAIRDITREHISSFLTHDTTLEHYRDVWTPTISNWDTNDWSKNDLIARAQKIIQERVDNAPECLIDPSIEKDMKKYIDAHLR